MGLLSSLFGGHQDQAPPDPTQGNWYDPLPQAQPPRENYSPHRLVNGGLRDVLGSLADAFNQSQGMDPLYAPKRNAEKISDAQSTFAQDPLAAIAKISRSDPKLGQAYYQDYLRQQKDAADNSRNKTNDFVDNSQKVRSLIGGLTRSATTPDAQAAAATQAQIIAQRAGIDISDMPKPGGPDYEQRMKDWTYGTIPVEKQLGSEYKGSRLEDFDLARQESARHHVATEGIGQQNANNGTTNANTNRQRSKAGVINNAARTTLQAAGLGIKAADSLGRVASRAETHRNNITPRPKAGGESQNVDGYGLRPGKRVGGTATLPSGKVVTWDGKNWK